MAKTAGDLASAEPVPLPWRALAQAIGRLPWNALAALGACLGLLAGSFLRIRRHHVERSMRRAGVPAPRRVAAAMYRALGAGAMELLWMAGRRCEDLGSIAQIVPESRALWDRVRGAGRGVVIAASHTGNWDLAACRVARDTPLLVVTKRLSVRSLDALWQTTRAGYGVRLVGAKGALSHGRAMLARGGCVAMMIDQVPDRARHSVAVDFLGATAWVDRAPAALAAKARAPLVVAGARRADDGTQRLEILTVLEPPPRPGRAWVEHATREATRALERFVLAYPSEWLWLHRRWRKPP